ncbi:hypothetical protein [Cytobacillus purgationiresistens]|uniref:Uncharacterized protein n=1 Tax=Cytobacillus purgationiresistens TaxID=863449 RepID=A0ABU0AMU0_9BACI|nr:hypothetical protein [Cytobacillus purgationiresistens]MDQ0272340.1 hypothetical protein [Cytobacillus purgationiresistens]
MKKKNTGFILIFLGIISLYLSFKFPMSPILAILLLVGSMILNVAGTIVLVKMIRSLQQQSSTEESEMQKKH